MDLRTLVNRVLPKLGEHPVTTLTLKHPTTAIILPIVQTKQEEFLGHGWWFNSYERTYYPGEDGTIALPDNLLSFIPKCVEAVQRGSQLYDPVTGLFTWTAPVVGEVIENLEFEELPPNVATYIFYSTLVDAYITDLGLAEDVRAWMTLADSALASVEAEHLKQKKYRTTRSPQYLRYRGALRG